MNYNTRLASTGLPSGCGSDKPLHRSAHHSHVRCRLVSISASVSILVAVFVSVFLVANRADLVVCDYTHGITRYWTEEGAGLGLDVIMHEGYGAGIKSGLSGFRTFPTDWGVVVNMPDPSSLGQDHAVKAHIYAGAISGDGWHINAFVYNSDQ